MFGFDPNYDPAAHEPTDEQVAEQVRTVELREEQDRLDAELGIEGLPRREREREREFYQDFARLLEQELGTGGG